MTSLGLTFYGDRGYTTESVYPAGGLAGYSGAGVECLSSLGRFHQSAGMRHEKKEFPKGCLMMWEETLVSLVRVELYTTLH